MRKAGLSACTNAAREECSKEEFQARINEFASKEAKACSVNKRLKKD